MPLDLTPYSNGRVWLVALAILALNVPFGYWREGLRKLSPLWFVAIHAPIPFAIALRWSVGLGFRLVTLPLFIAAYFLGQFAGGALRRRSGSRAPSAERRDPQ